MMENKISPKYLMSLISKIEKELWKQFGSYKNVRFYIDKWHKRVAGGENFKIYKKNDGHIDLLSTLHSMDGELLLKIAIELGIETPGFIPSIPIFKNIMKDVYPSAFDTFEKAIKQVINNPDIAIGLANSTLESIIKKILKYLGKNYKINKKTLYALTENILKEVSLYPDKNITDIKKIGSALLTIAQMIEKIRSEQTNFHGLNSNDMKINEPLYAYFIINTIATIGLFLDSLYKTKFQKEKEVGTDDIDVPF